MADSNKKSLRELLDSSLGELYKTPENPRYTLADLARSGDGLLNSEVSEGIGLAAEQRQKSIRETLGALFDTPAPGTEAFIQAVWEKAYAIPNIDARYVRQDRFGAAIARSEYGNYSDFGWHIDHHIPKSRGGSDSLFNSEPLHWRNNLAKSDDFV